MNSPSSLSVALVLATTLAARAAFAQSDPAAADALFQKGREAAEKGDWATACPKFAESQRLDPAPGTLLNLADCEEHSGALSLAYEHFKTAIEALPPNDDRLSYAKQRLAAVEKTLPHLTLAASPELPTGVKVKRDDVELTAASFGLPLPVNPGTHVIVVTAPGRVARRATVTLKPGEAITFLVVAGEPSRALVEEPTEDRAVASSGSTKTLGFVLGGLGIAGIGVGAVAGVLVLEDKSTIQNPAHCNAANHACDAVGVDAATSGKTMSLVSTASFIAGGALLGLGGYFVLTSTDSSQTATRTLVGPSMIANGAGLRVLQTF